MSEEILIVDDDARMAQSIDALLKIRGYRTQVTNDPRAAVELITHGVFQLVLIDLMMPEMTGFEVMDCINSRGERPVFIIITGDRSAEAAVEAIRKGAFDFIRKPFEADELIKRVENAFTQLRLKEERHQAVEALNRLNAQLEQAVAERTAKLVAANKQLNQEVQDRRRIEQSLRASERKYSTLVSNSPDLIYMLDREGRFNFVGGAVERLLKYSSDELIGRHFSSLATTSENTGAYYRINERRTGERATRGQEIQLKPKAGAWPVDKDAPPVFELYATGVYERAAEDGAADFVGTYGVARDITDRKKALRALERSEERFRELAELLPEILIETDLTGRLTFFNRKTIESTGYPEEALADGFSAVDLIAPEDRGRFKETCRAALRRAGTGDQEITLQAADGRALPVIMRSTLLSENDTPTGLRSLLVDITEIKKAREILRGLMEKAEIASGSKSEFLANMSHEIRTPLNGITSVCDLLADTSMDRKQREYVSIIQSSSKSLLGLINDILDFSKIEAGKLEFESIPFDLRSIVEDVADIFRDRVLEKNIEMVMDVSDAVPLRLIGDPLRLRQVLTNLMSNAVKFTREGEIHLIVDLHAAPEKDLSLLFRVRDTGIGIPPETQKRIFDAFTQADGSTTRKYGGTGLGLAICKRIVEMMGGRIWLRSGQGKGSDFLFTARFSRVVGESGLSRRLPPALKELRVLVVEDNPYLADVAKRMLEGFGCKAEVILTGEAALQRCRDAAKPPVDVALVAVDLPGLDGFTTSELIQQTAAAPAIIMLSADGGEKDTLRAEAGGMAACLVKPVKQSQLLDTFMDLFGAAAAPESIVPQDAAAVGEFTGTRVLLVEDNIINRRVAEEILKLSGIVVETAENGRVALEMVAGARYDAVLMDIQMPEIDGLAATRVIRETMGNRELPIIAMTAHAMQGDRDRCLDAGMDDYISKPIDRTVLFATLRRHIHAAARAAGAGEAVPGPPFGSLPGFDVADGVNRLGGDVSLFLDIVKMYCKDFKNVTSRIRQSVRAGDFDTAGRAAHSLKGASGNISATGVYQHAVALEGACKARDEAAVLVLTDKVDEEIRRIDTIREQLGRGDITI